jgi:hypothetical protein
VRVAPDGPGRGEADMSRMPPLPRPPTVLLGLLALACFGGPFALLVVLGGPGGGIPARSASEWMARNALAGASGSY